LPPSKKLLACSLAICQYCFCKLLLWFHVGWACSNTVGVLLPC
jgi:hypothetical protein